MLSQQVQHRDEQELGIFLTGHEADGQIVAKLLLGEDARIPGGQQARTQRVWISKARSGFLVVCCMFV
jgi:hypothetical protein